MAYVQPVQQKELDDLNQTGIGPVTTSGSNNDPFGGSTSNNNSSAITQATASPGTVPSQFVNFQDLVDANEPASTDYAGQVGNLIGLGDTTNAVNNDQSAANSAVSGGYHDVGDDVINKVLADPTSTNFDGYSTLQSILGGGGYTGPNTAQDLYGTSSGALKDLGDKASNLGNADGITADLLAKPNAGTTAGGAALDGALLANTKGSQQQIQGVQKQVADLQDTYNNDVAQTQANIGTNTSNATARKAAILGQATGAQGLGGIQSQANSDLASATAAQNSVVSQAQAAAKSGDFATLQSLIPGLSASDLAGIVGQLKAGSAPTDYSNDLTATGPALTVGNVLTPEQIARYQGIQNDFGLAPDDFIQGAGTGAKVNFNQADAIGQLNNLLSSQRATVAPGGGAAGTGTGTGGTATIGTGVSPTGSDTGGTNGLGQSAGGSGAASADSVGSPSNSGQDTNSVSTTPASTASTIGQVAMAALAPTPVSVMSAINAIANTISEAQALSNAAAISAANPTNTDVSAFSAMDAAPDTDTSTDANDSSTSPDGTSTTGTAADSSDAGDSSGSGTSGDSGSGGDGGGGGGGGGGKIICTAMNDMYGLPYRENKIWLMYAKRHLTPNHEVGYHKVFLPLVSYGFKQGDGIGNRVVRNALIWIGKNRTSDIKNELAGKPRNALHKFLRAVIEPTLAVIGKWSKK